MHERTLKLSQNVSNLSTVTVSGINNKLLHHLLRMLLKMLLIQFAGVLYVVFDIVRRIFIFISLSE